MKQRTLSEVVRILERRYPVVDALLDTFLDHEAIHTVETLLSYGERENTPEGYQELCDVAGNVDLEAARFGAYATFNRLCIEGGLNPDTTFELFADASGHYGTDMHTYQEYERVKRYAKSYEREGMEHLRNMRKNRKGA